jgi:hypothetical protein
MTLSAKPEIYEPFSKKPTQVHGHYSNMAIAWGDIYMQINLPRHHFITPVKSKIEGISPSIFDI